MANCSNPFIIELHTGFGTSTASSEHLAELAREATIAELLESLGADCLEIRFTHAPDFPD